MSFIKSLLIFLTILIPLAYSQVDPRICDGIPEFGFVASPEDCYIYYQCIEGDAFRLQCPRGTFFSTARQTCVPYDESDCPLMTTTVTPPSVLTCNDVPEFGFIPSWDFCDYYYQCIEGQQFLLKCPRGLYFSFERQTCVRPNESDCPLIFTTTTVVGTTVSPQTCSEVDEFGFITSPVACDYYYQCIEDQKFLLKCPRGLYFSFQRQDCVTADETECRI